MPNAVGIFDLMATALVQLPDSSHVRLMAIVAGNSKVQFFTKQIVSLEVLDEN